MIVRRRTMRRLNLNKCLVQGRWPMPIVEIKSECERTEEHKRTRFNQRIGKEDSAY